MSQPTTRLGYRELAVFVRRAPTAHRAADLLERFSRAALERAVREGVLRRVLPGVYVAREHLGSPEAVGSALNAWWPQAVVTGELALAIHRGDETAPRGAMVVVQHHTRSRAPKWLRVRSAYLDDDVATVRGIRCTPPAAAALDAWRQATPGRRQEQVYLALWDGLCTASQLLEAQRSQPTLVARGQLLRLLAHFKDGATSPLEVLAKTEVLIGPEFADLEWQEPMEIAGRDRTPDVLHREARVVIELDGWKYHGGAKKREKDRMRDNEFVSDGYAVLHFTMHDLLYRREWVRRTVLRAVRSGLARRAA
jgi:very-short-patch-repair endonuclease